MRKCTDEERQEKGTEEDIFVYWCSHQSVHPQIFPRVLIALVNSWRLFICCRLMQLKSHYVWMDVVPFCRAARQIWVTPAGSWSFRISIGVSCHQDLDSPHPSKKIKEKQQQTETHSQSTKKTNCTSACGSVLSAVEDLSFHSTETQWIRLSHSYRSVVYLKKKNKKGILKIIEHHLQLKSVPVLNRSDTDVLQNWASIWGGSKWGRPCNIPAAKEEDWETKKNLYGNF